MHQINFSAVCGMDAHQGAQLVLDWRDRRARASVERPTLSLGTLPESDLTVSCRYASRSHARIERRGRSWVLVDHSSNGSFVQTEDEQVIFVRRGEVRLWGEGWISLGEPLTEESAIRFRHG
jgi:adenylate cyclase